jgi:hypothetical protein
MKDCLIEIPLTSTLSLTYDSSFRKTVPRILARLACKYDCPASPLSRPSKISRVDTTSRA